MPITKVMTICNCIIPEYFLQQPLIHTLTYFSFSLAWQGECHVLLAGEPPNNQDGGEKVTYLTVLRFKQLKCLSIPCFRFTFTYLDLFFSDFSVLRCYIIKIAIHVLAGKNFFKNAVLKLNC